LPIEIENWKSKIGNSSVSDPGALSMVEPFLQVETVRAEAAMAMIKIAGAIMETHRDRAKMAMNKLLAVSKDEDLHKQAEEIILRIKGSEAFEDMMQKPER